MSREELSSLLREEQEGEEEDEEDRQRRTEERLDKLASRQARESQ